MGDIDTVYYRGQFEYVEFDCNIPKEDLVRFVVEVIMNIISIFQLENEVIKCNTVGRECYSLSKMARLVYYAYARGFTSPEVISDFAKHHVFFKFAANGIEPSDDAIALFIHKWGSFFDYAIKFMVQMGFVANLTQFESISVDSTPKKAANNKFNVLHEDDIKVLIRHLSGLNVDDEELANLRYPAKKFLKRTDIRNRRKLKNLNKILDKLHETESNTMPIHDIESIHITNKKKLADLGYNIQAAVDWRTKMIMAIDVTRNATDHNQFQNIILKAISNMGEIPDVSCADAGYNTRRTLEFIEEIGLNALIDNNRSAKLRNGHKNKNKFHKDNMEYYNNIDAFECFNKEFLYYQGTYVRWNDKKDDYEIKRKYFNKEACENCKYAEECCKSKYRTVEISGGLLALNMENKMKEYINSLEYIKRFSTVEPIMGILKHFFHIDEMLTLGVVGLQNRLNLCSGAFNLKRLYKELMKIAYENGENFMEMVKDTCSKAKIRMFVNEIRRFHFEEETLLLPMTCQSVVEKQNKEYLSKFQLLSPVELDAYGRIV